MDYEIELNSMSESDLGGVFLNLINKMDNSSSIIIKKSNNPILMLQAMSPANSMSRKKLAESLIETADRIRSKVNINEDELKTILGVENLY